MCSAAPNGFHLWTSASLVSTVAHLETLILAPLFLPASASKPRPGPYASPKYFLSCWLLFLSSPQLSAMSRQAGWKITPAPNGCNMGNWHVMCMWDDFPAASPSICLSRRHQSGEVHGQSTPSTGPLVWLCITQSSDLIMWFFIAWNNSIHLLHPRTGSSIPPKLQVRDKAFSHKDNHLGAALEKKYDWSCF